VRSSVCVWNDTGGTGSIPAHYLFHLFCFVSTTNKMQSYKIFFITAATASVGELKTHPR